MAGPRLTEEQRARLFAPLFKRVIADLQRISRGDSHLLWALRRKLAKQLTYLERSTPTKRKILKALMWGKQKGKCAICKKDMALKNSELDRKDTVLGYVESNVRLVHHECHIEDQARKRYA
ncbi:MAG: hypothetical protein HYX43_14675 [Burkholderiales bacterium]|nr:hypothetical protein [Burkholderiales bacterium]